MTESYHQPNQQIVPPRFNCLPFCEVGADNNSTVDILLDFPPEEVAQDPQFMFYLSSAYETEKAAPDPDDNVVEISAKTLQEGGPGLNLQNRMHLEGMVGHTITHAVSGLLDAGVSGTRSIPYWDRQAAIVGMEFQDPSRAAERAELMDVLSMNVLRAYCHYSVAKIEEHSLSVFLLDAALEKGQRSMRDMSPAQRERRNVRQSETDMHTSLFIAKFKHLLWLVDVQPNPAIRHAMSSEVRSWMDYATTGIEIPIEDLTIDMGVDTGMSSSTDRPLYDISMFKQLAHLHDPEASQQTYSLPQNLCHRLGVFDVLRSIDREGVSLPFYESDGRYRLPWIFEE